MAGSNIIEDLMYSPEVLHKTASHTTNLADGAGATVSVSVPGAALGDFVLVAPASDGLDLIYTGYVSAADTVEVRVQNESGGAVNDDITINIMVLPRKR